MEYSEPYIAPFLVETVTDWNMLIVTLTVGIFSVLATIIAVWYTNKKHENSMRKQGQRKKNKMLCL